MSAERRQLAEELFQKAYMLQMEGRLDLAVEMYQESINACPTAEAYTFLGWTYRFQGRLNDAIAECRKAIEVDPSYGNPYNDIGAYLIEQGKHEEAIPWLEQATESERYESYHYPWYNLGRAHAALEAYNRARECFTKALIIQPDYRLAEEALQKVRMLLQ
jgi:tetratricopeptide (TPR) repeat protein